MLHVLLAFKIKLAFRHKNVDIMENATQNLLEMNHGC